MGQGQRNKLRVDSPVVDLADLCSLVPSGWIETGAGHGIRSDKGLERGQVKEG